MNPFAYLRNRIMNKRQIKISPALLAEIMKGFRYCRFYSNQGADPNTIILEWWGSTYLLELRLFRLRRNESPSIEEFAEPVGTIGVGMNPLHSEGE